jgi:hypothetical protein
MLVCQCQERLATRMNVYMFGLSWTLASVPRCALGSRVTRWAVISRFNAMSGRLDLPEFEQFEAERLNLTDHAEHRRAVLEEAREHGVAASQLRRH